MTSTDPNDTDVLLERARKGDVGACDALLDHHRRRLRRMFSIWMDRRLAVRVDPSDAVQDTLILAAKRLPEYLDDPPLPFYAWLRQMAWERLLQLRRRHVQTEKRSIRRETWLDPQLPDQSAHRLVNRLVASDMRPDRVLHQKEQQRHVRRALDRLSTQDREVLVLFHLEELSTKEIAGILNVSPGAVSLRHFRALRRLKDVLQEIDHSEQ